MKEKIYSREELAAELGRMAEAAWRLKRREDYAVLSQATLTLERDAKRIADDRRTIDGLRHRARLVAQEEDRRLGREDA